MAYSDAEKAEALITLAKNRYDYRESAAELNIPARTLRRWDKDVPKKGVFQLLERAIWHMLAAVPETWKTGSDWAVALGILLDKYQLMQGEPTERSEQIVHGYRDLTEEERNIVVERAKEYLGLNGRAGDTAE